MGTRPWGSDRRSVLLKIPVPHLHAVTNDRVLSLRDFAIRAAALTQYDRIALHLRSHDRPVAERLHLARQIRGAGPFIVNDRIDLAAAAHADGVHLPAFGLPIQAARSLMGPSVLVGRSTHSPAEALAAHADGADYVFLGPIWDTASHPGAPGIGVEAIAEAHPARVIAVGGITPERAAACVAAGAWGVAVISALWLAEDIAATAEAFLLSLER